MSISLASYSATIYGYVIHHDHLADTLPFLFNSPQSSSDACYIARHVGLKAGVSIASPALTVSRLCGSGFQSIISGAQVRT